jgi:hypothetical protein
MLQQKKSLAVSIREKYEHEIKHYKSSIQLHNIALKFM